MGDASLPPEPPEAEAPPPVDAVLGVALRGSERVLWAGRPGRGVPRHERQRMAQAVRSVAVALFALGGLCLLPVFGRADDPASFGVALAIWAASAAAWAVLPAAFLGGVLFLGRWIGGAYVSVVVALLLAPTLALVWGLTVANAGLGGAVELLGSGPFWVGVGALALAVGHITRILLRNLHTHYYVTDQRVLEVRRSVAGQAHVVWSTPLPRGWLELRVVWPFGARRRGHIAIGTGRRRRLLRNLEHPDLVLEDIKRIVATAERPVGRRLPLAARAGRGAGAAGAAAAGEAAPEEAPASQADDAAPPPAGEERGADRPGGAPPQPAS